MTNRPSIVFFALGNGLANELSGGTVKAYETVRGLCPEWDVDFVVTSGGREAFQDYFASDPAVLKHVKLVELRASLLLKREPFRLFRAWSYLLTTLHALLWACLTRKHCQVVYPSSDFFFDILPAMILQLRGRAKKLVGVSFHLYPPAKERTGLWLVNEAMYQLQRWSLRALSKRADAYVFLDTEAGEQLKLIVRDLGLQGPALMVKAGLRLHNRPRDESVQGRYDLVQIGMRPSKGIYDLPKILSRIVSRYPQIRLGCIGQIADDDRKRLTTALAEHGLHTNVTLLGRVPEPAKNSLLARARVFIAPSHEEGWGIGVAEALSLGVPSVGYALPAYQGAFGESVCYAPCFDTDVFADRVIALLDDTELTQHMIRLGLTATAGYDWGAVLTEEKKLLQSLS